MSLVKSEYSLVIDGGINTKADDKLVGPGENLVLENAEFNEVGALNKRNGFEKITDNTSDSKLLSNLLPSNIIEHGKELIALGNPGSEDLYSYDPQNTIWSKKNGELVSPFVFVEDKFTDNRNSFCPSIAELKNNNTRIIAYKTNDEDLINTEVYIKVFIQNTITKEKKQIFETSTSGAGNEINFVQVRALDVSNPIIFLLYTIKNGVNYDLRMAKIQKDGTLIGTTTIDSTPIANVLLSFNTCFVGNNLFIAYSGTAVNKLCTAYINGLTGAVLSTLTFNTAKWLEAGAENCYSLVVVGNKILVSYTTVETSYQIAIVGFDVTSGSIVQYLENSYGSTGATSKPRKVSTILVASNTKIVSVWEINSATFNSVINVNIVDVNTGAQSSWVRNQSMVLVGACFKIDSSNDIYFIGQSGIINQERYYICKVRYSDSKVSIVGSFAVNGQAILHKMAIIGSPSLRYINRLLPEVFVGADGNYYFPSLYVTREIGIFDTTSVDSKNLVGSVFINRFEFSSKYEGLSAKLGGNTYIAGSITREYDGINLLEQSFVDSNYISLSQGGSPGMPAGKYQYTGIYEYLDSNGQLHRSSPFNIAELDSNGNSILVTIQSLTDGFIGVAKGTKKYQLILYRTEKNGEVFYRLGGTIRSMQLYGIKSGIYEDMIDDATLLNSEQLYNSNGILDNTALPPIKSITVANNRLFAISSEDENEVLYSQPYLYGECVNFSPFLSFRIDAGLLSRSGVGESLASLDGKVIIFKDQSIAYFYGDGPNQAGLQNDYSDPKLISSDVGLKDVKSIVSIPDGIMFKSNKGIYLLDRSLQLSYIGYPVEDFNSEEIIGTSNIVDKHIVLFMTANRTLMFDYFQKKWSTWTISGSALTTYNKLPAYIDSSYRIRLQNTSYLDDSTRYSLKLVTPWIKLSGIQNYQRIYKLMILGLFYSQHDLIVKSYYDYNESDFDTYTVNPLITDDIYQYDISITKQKGQAMKFEIYDTSSSGTNKSCKLSNLSMILGKKRGLNKTPDQRKY